MCKICWEGDKLTTLYPSTSTISSHLRSAHNLVKTTASTLKQTRLDLPIKRNNLSQEDQKVANRKLSLAIGASSIPNSIVEDPFFKDFIGFICPGHRCAKLLEIFE